MVEHPLLISRRMQRLPRVDAPARGPEPGQPQLGPVALRDVGEPIELGHVLAGHDHADLELPEVGRRQVVHGRPGGRKRSLAPHGVVGGGQGAVQADLHIDVVHGGQAARPVRGEPGPVGGELHADLVVDGVGEQVEEVRAQHGLAAADVHVEHLHGSQLVHHAAGLGRRQLPRVAAARRAEAVDAGQVAGVGELPGQADRGVEPLGEPLPQGHGLNRHG